MSGFQPRDVHYQARVRNSFARQTFMRFIGAELVHLAPGEVDLTVARRSELTQQHGLFHGGVTSSLADSAAGYAALSLFEADTGVLTTEFKINLLAPASGEWLTAKGRVVKPGRTLSVCRAEVFSRQTGQTGKDILCAVALLTMMQVAGLDD